MDLILFHGHCPDGWCATYIASKKYPEAKLIPLDHGADHTAILKECEGKDVLMLDFSLRTRKENDVFAARTKSFQIYDHHKTAQTVLENAPYATFDMKRSGAGLTWDYLFGRNSTGEWTRDREEREHGVDIGIPRPWWVEYTEIRDLWQWERRSDSRQVCAFLGTLPFDVPSWRYLEGKTLEDANVLGWGALAHINHYVREAVKQAQAGTLQGYKTAVLNVPYLNCSEIGNELAKTHEVSLTWFERGDGIIQFSLRSTGDIDVSVIAKSFDGGGHKNASGFQLDLVTGRNLVDTILGRGVFYNQTHSLGGCVK